MSVPSRRGSRWPPAPFPLELRYFSRPFLPTIKQRDLNKAVMSNPLYDCSFACHEISSRPFNRRSSKAGDKIRRSRNTIGHARFRACAKPCASHFHESTITKPEGGPPKTRDPCRASLVSFCETNDSPVTSHYRQERFRHTPSPRGVLIGHLWRDATHPGSFDKRKNFQHVWAVQSGWCSALVLASHMSITSSFIARLFLLACTRTFSYLS